MKKKILTLNQEIVKQLHQRIDELERLVRELQSELQLRPDYISTPVQPNWTPINIPFNTPWYTTPNITTTQTYETPVFQVFNLQQGQNQ